MPALSWSLWEQRKVAAAGSAQAARIAEPVSAWYVFDVLRGSPPPANAQAGRIAYKTGTSYGYRDAWAIGFDRRVTIGVWVGRPDGSAVGLEGQIRRDWSGGWLGLSGDYTQARVDGGSAAPQLTGLRPAQTPRRKPRIALLRPGTVDTRGPRVASHAPGPGAH